MAQRRARWLSKNGKAPGPFDEPFVLTVFNLGLGSGQTGNGYPEGRATDVI